MLTKRAELVFASATGLVLLGSITVLTTAGGGGGGGGGPLLGEVATETVVFEEPFFGSYTVTKEATVCFDPGCFADAGGGGVLGDGNGNGNQVAVCHIPPGNPDNAHTVWVSPNAVQAHLNHGDFLGECDDAPPPPPPPDDVCDPFPDDGLFTYIYKLTNHAESNNSLIGWVIDTTVPGSIVAAGFLPGPGVVPSSVEIRNDDSLVEWDYFVDTIDPGETSVCMYIVSAHGPDQVDSTVLGDFGLDAPGTCFGPAVDCDICDDGCYSCPSGPAQSPPCPDDGDGLEPTLIIKQGACPAPINPGSNGKSKFLLVGDTDFDIFDVVVGSLELRRADGVGGVAFPLNGIKPKDLNHPFTGDGPCSCNANQSSDGIKDLEMKFSNADLGNVLELDGEAPGSVHTLVLSGELEDGTTFEATDCVRIVGGGGGGGGGGLGSANPFSTGQ